MFSKLCDDIQVKIVYYLQLEDVSQLHTVSTWVHQFLNLEKVESILNELRRDHAHRHHPLRILVDALVLNGYYPQTNQLSKVHLCDTLTESEVEGKPCYLPTANWVTMEDDGLTVSRQRKRYPWSYNITIEELFEYDHIQHNDDNYRIIAHKNFYTWMNFIYNELEWAKQQYEKEEYDFYILSDMYYTLLGDRYPHTERSVMIQSIEDSLQLPIILKWFVGHPSFICAVAHLLDVSTTKVKAYINCAKEAALVASQKFSL